MFSKKDEKTEFRIEALNEKAVEKLRAEVEVQNKGKVEEVEEGVFRIVFFGKRLKKIFEKVGFSPVTTWLADNLDLYKGEDYEVVYDGTV